MICWSSTVKAERHVLVVELLKALKGRVISLQQHSLHNLDILSWWKRHNLSVTTASSRHGNASSPSLISRVSEQPSCRQASGCFYDGFSRPTHSLAAVGTHFELPLSPSQRLLALRCYLNLDAWHYYDETPEDPYRKSRNGALNASQTSMARIGIPRLNVSSICSALWDFHQGTALHGTLGKICKAI